ncbi:hypothetical protein SNE40_018155 [Patella caerulea]|uniref:Uncharacterized protein n=1 Tax=Patella caerulea TaxID=87958 RepID=A0AAN8P6P3_PATCE
MLRLQKYGFEGHYKKGSHMFLADTLSRAYLPYVKTIQNDDGHVLSVNTRSMTAKEAESVCVIDHLAISDHRISEIQKGNI